MGENDKDLNGFIPRSLEIIKGVVSKDTVVLRRWGSSTLYTKIGFINGVDNDEMIYEMDHI